MAYGGYARLNVLVVDDFDSFRMTVNKMLQDFGVQQIDTARSGQEAIRQCGAKRYDLVLCDHNLGPGKNGHQVLEELRQRELLGPEGLFVLVSAESSKSIVLAASDYAPDGYLTKPITPQTLQQRLDRALKQRDEMLPINKAVAAGELDQAIDLCRQKIDSRSRYAGSCQKLLAELYLKTEQWDAAEAIYTQVLEVRQLDWAQVGLARVKQARGELAQAGQWLTDIIQASPMCMAAYDALAENKRLEDDPEGLEQVLQQAVNVSPLALARQKQLAYTARNNNHLDQAAKAFKNTVKLAENSCYDAITIHLDFARAAAAWAKEDAAAAADIARDALNNLDKLEKKFKPSQSDKLQSELIEVQIFAAQGDAKRAREQLQEIEEELDFDNWNLDLDASLDFVQALEATGQRDRVKTSVEKLSELYRDDQSALNRIDRLLDEPLSEHNRQLVASINRRGIECYENKDFSAAIELFKKAQRLFPNHIGVQLNLVQANIGEMREYGAVAEVIENCMGLLERVGDRLDPAHPQMARYRKLNEMLRAVERETRGE